MLALCINGTNANTQEHALTDHACQPNVCICGYVQTQIQNLGELSLAVLVQLVLVYFIRSTSFEVLPVLWPLHICCN